MIRFRVQPKAFPPSLNPPKSSLALFLRCRRNKPLGNAAQDGSDVRAERREGSDGKQRNQYQNQGVLGQRLSFLTLRQCRAKAKT